MKSIFNKADYQEIVARVNKVNADTKGLWGKMNAGQMMSHCAVAAGMALGLAEVKDNSNFIKRLFFKNYILSDKPFKKELPTGKEFIMTDEKDFETEKQKLLHALSAACTNGANGKWGIHSLVGKLT